MTMFRDVDEEYYDMQMRNAGWMKEDEVPDIEALRDWLRAALDAVYVTGDADELCVALDELCAHLDVPSVGDVEPLLLRKTAFSRSLDFHLGWQRGLAEGRRSDAR